jgi:hypothetical protein
MFKNRWVWVLLIFFAAALGLNLFASSPALVESWYSKGLFSLLSGVLIPLTGFIPFSLFEWIVLCLMLSLLYLLVRWIRAWHRKDRSFRNAMGNLLLRTAVLLLGVYLWFLLCWGLNYHRLPLPEKMEITPTQPKQEQFLVVSEWITLEMIRLHDQGVNREADPGTESALISLDRVIARLDGPVPDTSIRIKHLLWNLPMDATGTLGVISPFTLELHLSKSLFPEERPFYAAHEAAHLRGYGSETEANLLAFEACMESELPLTRFSGFFCICYYLYGALSKEERKSLFSRWPEGMKDLARRIDERNRRYEGGFRDAMHKAYDLYLRSNKQKEGIRTYSMAGGWITRLHFEEAKAALQAKEKQLKR